MIDKTKDQYLEEVIQIIRHNGKYTKYLLHKNRVRTCLLPYLGKPLDLLKLTFVNLQFSYGIKPGNYIRVRH